MQQPFAAYLKWQPFSYGLNCVAATATKKRCFGPPWTLKYFGKPCWKLFSKIKNKAFFESILDADNDRSIIDDLWIQSLRKRIPELKTSLEKMFNKK